MKYKTSTCWPGFTIALLFISCSVAVNAQEKPIVPGAPDTIYFKSGEIDLLGLLWKPIGMAKAPAVLYNHSSERDPQKYLSKTAATFIEKGTVFLCLSVGGRV